MSEDYYVDLSIQSNHTLSYLSQSNSSQNELANQELYRRFTPLIHKLANKIGCNPFIVEDLVQVGSLALMDALAKYDLNRNTQLITYLYPCLKGSMINLLKKERKYSASYNSIDEYPILKSLSEPIPEKLLQKNSESLVEDRIADNKETNCPHRIAFLKEFIELIDKACSLLSDQQHRVFKLYIVDELRPSEIANMLNISRPRVTVILKKALNKVRLELADKL
jgi:RNA polymerase sigma factor (sigma-70 family)